MFKPTPLDLAGQLAREGHNAWLWDQAFDLMQEYWLHLYASQLCDQTCNDCVADLDFMVETALHGGSFGELDQACWDYIIAGLLKLSEGAED